MRDLFDIGIDCTNIIAWIYDAMNEAKGEVDLEKICREAYEREYEYCVEIALEEITKDEIADYIDNFYEFDEDGNEIDIGTSREDLIDTLYEEDNLLDAFVVNSDDFGITMENIGEELKKGDDEDKALLVALKMINIYKE